MLFRFLSLPLQCDQKKTNNEQLKIHAMIETLILLGCLYLSIRITDYVEKQKQNNNNNNLKM